MPAWNQALFLIINAPPDAPAPLVEAARILASSPVAVVPTLLVALWVWGGRAGRGGLLASAAAVLLALGINQILGTIYVEPRPFMIGVGRTLIQHAPDNSFPSDHATLVWTLTAGLIATGAAPRWGVAMGIYGLGVAWARVFLGVHFPLDMLGSAVVAVAGAGLARLLLRWLAPWLVPAVEAIYERCLALSRLPPSLVPRAEPVPLPGKR
jgi:undecaprenyl-diphosphatase